jgi:hypothetical protein
MPIGIVFACADHCNARMHHREKFRRCGVLAAMMTDLQNIGAKCGFVVIRQDGTLRLLLRVSG